MTIGTPAPEIGRIVEACAGNGRSIHALIHEAVRRHAETTGASLSLVASHNHMSPAALAMLSSPVADEIMSGEIGSRAHSGGAWIDVIDSIVVELSKRLFGAAAVEYRAMSGAMANGLALLGVTSPGMTVLALPERFGGHRTYREGGWAGVLGVRVEDVPCDEGGSVDLDPLANAIERLRPSWILLGTAELLFPYPLARLREIADPFGVRIFYDGAHILGLVAGGAFQDPLREGAVLLTGSGQKTLGGPISGLVLTTDPELGAKIAARTSGVVSNYQNNRVAALAVTLAEAVEFGPAFAQQTVRNARALGGALAAAGVPVLAAERGYTASHLLLVDTTALRDGASAFRRLGQARILASQVPLPATHPRRQGIRLGVPALTRLGMREPEMEIVGDLVARILVAAEPPDAVAPRVTEFASAFRKVGYCYSEVEP